MQKRFARICWNSKGWLKPTGECGRLESGTFAARSGFGHEEWLFDYGKILNRGGEQFHYGFLEPVNNSLKQFKDRKLVDRKLEVLLYSIDSNRQRKYIGRIRECQVLNLLEWREAYDDYKERGWVAKMRAQIEDVKGDPAALEYGEFSLFNIRFRPEDVEFLRPYPVARPDEYITKLDRYKLYDTTASAEKEWRKKTARSHRNTQHFFQQGHEGVWADLRHARMQEQLFLLLSEHYGRESVLREIDDIDLQACTVNRKTLIEIKVETVPRLAIRAALGQILEYAHYKSKMPAHLMILAPAPSTADISTYIGFLRKSFGLPVSYCEFSEDMIRLPRELQEIDRDNSSQYLPQD